MIIVEVEDGGNMSILRRLQENGFRHDEKRDYIDQTTGGNNIEVWTKPDGKSAKTIIDISDLPETED